MSRGGATLRRLWRVVSVCPMLIALSATSGNAQAPDSGCRAEARSERQTHMAANNLENVDSILHALETSGSMGDVIIEYWFGGGQPPPFYRSDQVRLCRGVHGDFVQFATVAYAPYFDPANLVVRFQVSASSNVVRTIARLMRESHAFDQSHPEEGGAKATDVLSTELIVSQGDRRAEKRFYRDVPDSLQTLESAFRSLMADAVNRGSAKVFHEGEEL